MASAQYNRYIWLVDTIRSAGKITRAEIDRKWSYSHYNENHETTFPDRSFFRCKREIKSIFGIEIKCKRSRECSIYYIANPDDDSHSQTKQWLLSEFALSQSLDASRELQDQIVYEHIPEGTQYLTTIVEALRDHKILLISHLRFDSNEPPHVFYMSPLCLKAFKQRWYIIGLIEELDGTNKTGNEPRTYALDRVKHLELTDRKFKYPKNFHPQEYFAPHYGVFCGKDYKPEFIRARFIEKAAPYVRTLPLHHSQKEVEPCVFEWYVAPTLDFIQQLRTYSAEMEILAPKSLRDKFRQDAEAVANLYK